MPIKRKASGAKTGRDSPPFKRRTRSQGPLQDTQLATTPRTRVVHDHTANCSTENFDADVEDEEEDRLPRHRGILPLRATTETRSSANRRTPPLPPRTHRGTAPLPGHADKDPAVLLPTSTTGIRDDVSLSIQLRNRAGNSNAPSKDSSSEAKMPIASPSQSSHGLKRSTRVVRASASLRTRGGSSGDGPAPSQSSLRVPRDTGATPDEGIRAGAQDGEEVAKREVDTRTLEENASEVEEVDELLLIAYPSPRPITPPKIAQETTPPRSGTSSAAVNARYVMHSVQITTPSWLKSHSTRGIASPGRSNTPSALPFTSGSSLPLIPSTPTRAKLSKPLPSSSKRSPRVSISEKEIDNIPTDIQHEEFSPIKRTPGRPSVREKKNTLASPAQGPFKFPLVLPEYLAPCLQAQKHVTMTSLHTLPHMLEVEGMETHPNIVAHEQLTKLLLGTVTRSEGNSCLITGPRGSGKTRLFEDVVATLPEVPNVIRLSGYTQTNDRLAIREIAWQLAQQTGTSLLPLDEETEANDPFAEGNEHSVLVLPPSSHLLALISIIPTLSRPTIIVLDAFDLFALHPRQSLLYCLFDTVQHSRVSTNGKGLAVVGITTRVDTINLLEKRVKSRFSGRMLRTACPGELSTWTIIAKRALCTPIESYLSSEWTPMWEAAVEQLLNDKVMQEFLLDTFSLTRDLRLLSRIFVPLILELTPASPFPSSRSIITMLETQRSPASGALHYTMSYPSTCLLIAAMHAQTSGHEVFTFEMLHEAFTDQVRASLSAPIQVQGGGIGMVRCSREILMTAFEHLVSRKALVAVSGFSKGFTRYRCALDRAEIKQVVEKMGQLSLKKWLTKAQ